MTTLARKLVTCNGRIVVHDGKFAIYEKQLVLKINGVPLNTLFGSSSFIADNFGPAVSSQYTFTATGSWSDTEGDVTDTGSGSGTVQMTYTFTPPCILTGSSYAHNNTSPRSYSFSTSSESGHGTYTCTYAVSPTSTVLAGSSFGMFRIIVYRQNADTTLTQIYDTQNPESSAILERDGAFVVVIEHLQCLYSSSASMSYTGVKIKANDEEVETSGNCSISFSQAHRNISARCRLTVADGELVSQVWLPAYSGVSMDGGVPYTQAIEACFTKFLPYVSSDFHDRLLSLRPSEFSVPSDAFTDTGVLSLPFVFSL